MASSYRPSYSSRRAPEPPRYREDYDLRRANHYYNMDQTRSHAHPDRHYERPAEQFSFRGAANRTGEMPDSQYQFTFSDPSLPKFPQRAELPYRGPSPVPSNAPSRRNKKSRGRQSYGHYSQERARAGARFGPRPAHGRDILHTVPRGSTPELLAGMNMNGDSYVRNEDQSDKMQSDNDSDVAKPSRPSKRVKVQPVAPTSGELPKWSNPDLDIALPPPATLAQKLDITEIIRNKKLQTSAAKSNSTSLVVANADFVPLSDLDRNFEAPNPGIASFALPKWPAVNDRVGPPPPPPKGLAIPEEDELQEISIPPPKGKNPKKRKLVLEPFDTGLIPILPEWKLTGPGSTPWFKPEHVGVYGQEGIRARFHQEVCDYVAFVQPEAWEEQARQRLVNRVNNAVKKSNLPHAHQVEVRPFGSFASGLYLPIADMDLVVISNDYKQRGMKTFCQTNNSMHRLAAHLRQVIAIPTSVVPIVKAKVPIVKFIDQLTELKVDISFENDTGITARHTIMAWAAKYPAMRPLVLIIKQFLTMYGQHEVFHGGLGGFSIICLVVSMLQHTPESTHGNFGDLLLRFFDIYADFDIRKTGIVMNPPGFYDKVKHPRRCQNANRLTIIDPNKRDNDISGGSRYFTDLQKLFRNAYRLLNGRLVDVQDGKDVKGSLLGPILGGDYLLHADQRAALQRGL